MHWTILVFLFISQTYLVNAVLNQSCASGADCSDSECCISNTRPIGKRSDGGHCAAMGTSGSSCYVRQGSGKSAHMAFVDCPCNISLTCHGKGVYDVPLGEVGICDN